MAKLKLGKIKLRGVALLLYIAKLVAAEPRRMDMDSWGFKFTPSGTQSNALPPCGTVGCISGWAGFLAMGDFGSSPARRGQRLLGLTKRQADRLFYTENWPQELSDAYDKAFSLPPLKRAEVRADLTVKVINLMVKELKAQNLAKRRARYNAKRKAFRAAAAQEKLDRETLEEILRQTPKPKLRGGKVTELTIDRRAHGVGEAGGSLLNPSNNKMCCLGHLCFAEGVELDEMKNISFPADLTEADNVKANEQMDYQEQQDIGEINDNSSLKRGEREQKLTAEFKEKGIKLKFV